MKKAILLVKNNKEVASKMIKEGFLYSQRFTDEKVANEFIKSYKSV